MDNNHKGTREEIEQLIKELKTSAKPIEKQLCSCAFVSWHSRHNFDFLLDAIQTENYDWIKEAIPLVISGIFLMEETCQAKLTSVYPYIEKIKSYYEGRDLPHLRSTYFDMMKQISQEMFMCGRNA